MNKIKILSEKISNRIAAGEVVERPASIVKELVENSLDAGSTAITIAIEDGGKKLIQVVDNGCGMSEDDALTSFERHATSKISKIEDIFKISTLGFRGEALPSISAVSNMTLITKLEEDDIATQVDIDNGVMRNATKTSGNTGTTIIVRQLFANIPARRKFLKSVQVEARHIINYVYYQAILYPHVHFKLIINGKVRLNYPVVQTKKHRMLSIFGSDFEKRDMFEIFYEKEGMQISGFIKGLEEITEGMNDYHYIFINGRYIKDKIMLHSLKAAYEPFIKKIRIFQNAKTPPHILFFNITPEQVDCNVHPAKLEIRFRDAQSVHGFVKQAITQALMSYEEEKFQSIKKKFESPTTFEKPSAAEINTYRKKVEYKETKPVFDNYVRDSFQKLYQPDLFHEKYRNYPSDVKSVVTDDNSDITSTENAQVNRPEEHVNYFLLSKEEELINPWQLHQSYVLVQIEEGLLMIDQHAAHERILYEKILHRIHGAPAPTQKLLFPIVIDIPPILQHVVPELISENLEIFHKIGFSLKTFSGSSIVIEEIPAELEDWDGGEVFIDIIKQLQDEFSETSDFRDSLAKSVSCKAAIKAGKKMSQKEMVALINDLFSCEVPYFCPHGRPLIIKMTLTELEKRFKRIENH